MAVPPNAVRFDQTQDTRFYLCRHCRNHVLSSENCIYPLAEANGIGLLCENPVNVRVDAIILHWFSHHQPVATVSCNACNRNLGQRFIRVEEPNQVNLGRRFIFYRNRMLYWNGNRLVYADTNEPVDPVDD